MTEPQPCSDPECRDGWYWVDVGGNLGQIRQRCSSPAHRETKPQVSRPEDLAPAPRCATCKHWTPDSGECDKLGQDGQFGAWADGYEVENYGFQCPPTFGCVLHEVASESPSGE